MKRILRNRAKCLICGDVIESASRHDYVSCSCGAISVDGGTDYLKRSFAPGAKWEDLSVTIPDDGPDETDHSNNDNHKEEEYYAEKKESDN